MNKHKHLTAIAERCSTLCHQLQLSRYQNFPSPSLMPRLAVAVAFGLFLTFTPTIALSIFAEIDLI